MPNEHSPGKEEKGTLQAIKDRLYPSLSKLPRRSGSPIPPDASSDKDQQRPWSFRKILGKHTSTPSRPTSPRPPPSSDNQIPESPLNPLVATSRNDSPAPQPLATPSAGQNPHDPTTQAGPTATTSPSQADASVIDSQLTSPKTISTTIDRLKVTGRFIQTLMTKLPQIVDGNPVKMALSLAKVIIEIKQGVEDNMDAVERKIASAGAQLDTVAKALNGWQTKNEKERECVKRLETVLKEELAKLGQLSEEWIGRKVADYEDEKSRIAEIFECVNEARIQFGLETDLRIFKAVHAIEENHRRALLKDLLPSDLADHKYHLEGEKKGVLRRAVCTHGTRARLLGDVVTWAKGSSSETIYWLFGPAGSGKTTIAYTIARRFELATPEDTIVLGGNFFSSRQFDETKYSTRIIRTIVYHLALRCKAFADALTHSGKFDAVNQDVRAQLDGLLITPWQAYESARLADPSRPPPQYLIVIDALDEIDGSGGSEFLCELLNVINEKSLNGLKFFVTSRPDPKLVTHVSSFADKQLYRLEEVPFEEAQADIRMYLKTSLPVGDKAIEQIVTAAAGLFIYASTVVKYLGNLTSKEQKRLLRKLFSASTSQIVPDATALLDNLYIQILQHAFGNVTGDIRQHRLNILFTFLCTSERTSTSVVTELVTDDFNPDSDSSSVAEINSAVTETSIADDTLQRLYAVLYTENSKVLWYHKSFPDFLFDQNRSNDFWCDQAEHHRRLTDSCFRVMKEGLRFNIANIESSYVFDRDNSTLPDAVTGNISPTLSYSCRNWDQHLSSTASSALDSLHEILSEFLRDRALFWIEAMNLLGLCGLCYQMLRKVSEWVTNTDTALAEQLAEVARFALYFSGSPAASSTPHLYISALSTWPRDSEPCGRWRSRFRGLPVFKNAARGGALSLVTISVGSEVNSVAFSNDGTQIVSGSWDHSVRVWDVSTGKELNVLNGHTAWVNSVAFSNDGTRIVSGSGDYSVRVWDVSSGKELNVLNGHTFSVTSVAFSTDGTCIVSGSRSSSVRVWDASTGKGLNELNGHTDSVNSVAFSTDGTRIVSGSEDYSVRVWDASTGKELNVLNGHTHIVNSVAFSTDGTRIVSGSSDRSVRIWDASTGKELNVLNNHTSSVNSVAFSNDGTRIVSGSDDKSVRMWDVLTGKELNVLNGHTDPVNSVAFSTDDTRTISGSLDKSVWVWDASTSEELNVLNGHTSSVYSVAFSNDGTWIVSGSEDYSVRVWDASTGKELNILNGHTRSVHSVAFSTDGTRIVSSSRDESVRVWDALTGEELNVLNGHTSLVHSVAFSTDGTRIVSGSGDCSVRVWDALTGKELIVLNGHTYLVTSAAFSTDGTRIVSGSLDESVRVWEASTGKELNVLNGHTSSVYSVAFSTDGTRIVSGSGDESVRVWDALTGEELNVLNGHTSLVHSVAFSTDGTWIVSGSSDCSVRVWDASTGKEFNVLNGHTSLVHSVAFSTDGTRIVSGSSDRSVRVWGVSMGKELNLPNGHTRSVQSVAFSTDGTHTVSGSEDNSLQVWDIQTRYIREQTDGITYTGWLLSANRQAYLMFVPIDALLPDSSNILTIPHSAASSVDFTNAAIGSRWRTCYTP